MKKYLSTLLACLLSSTALFSVPTNSPQAYASSGTYKSSDLRWHDLHGPVKSFVSYNSFYDYTSYPTYFDINGRIISKGRMPYDHIRRDSQGRITKISYHWETESADPEQYQITFTYDSYGNILRDEEGGWEYYSRSKYEYSNGRCCREHKYENSDAGEGNVVLYYTYSNFDTHGNWTRCSVHEIGTFLDLGEEVPKKVDEHYTITRRITYY